MDEREITVSNGTVEQKRTWNKNVLKEEGCWKPGVTVTLASCSAHKHPLEQQTIADFGMQRDPRIGFKTACFSLLVCQHPETREFLAVDEMSGDGWWLPGGQVCSGETFLQTCHVKALQEAGVEVDVTGILAVEHSITGPKGEEDEARMRVIYFGHPKDSSSKPRNAEWKSIHGQYCYLPS